MNAKCWNKGPQDIKIGQTGRNSLIADMIVYHTVYDADDMSLYISVTFFYYNFC